MMIIDMHVHFFADRIAASARKKLTGVARIPAYTDFTESDTRAKLAQWGVDLGILLPIATKPSQQQVVNDWAKSVCHGNIRSFGSVYPLAGGDALRELDRIVSLGLYGVKLHPDYQEFYANDRAVYPVYQKISDLALPLTFHAGYDPVSPQSVHATPQMIAEVADDFPGLNIIAAHLGGWQCAMESEQYLVGKNIYMDISMSGLFHSQDEFARIIKNHGADKILFGSDCPWSLPGTILDMLDQAPLSQRERDQILYQNAAALLGLDLEN
jgi:predicted TIM-barrel fold metal-dependent hydrolase